MRELGSIILYVHGSQKARLDGQPRTATSTLTQFLNYGGRERDRERDIERWRWRCGWVEDIPVKQA